MRCLNNLDLKGWLFTILLLFPWLTPYTAGLTPNAWPWLLSALCAVFLWLLRRRLHPERVAVGWVGAAVISALIGLV